MYSIKPMKVPKMKVPKLPHAMFKGTMKKMAKTVAEHKMLERMGYTHTKPKL